MAIHKNILRELLSTVYSEEISPFKKLNQIAEQYYLNTESTSQDEFSTRTLTNSESIYSTCVGGSTPPT
jgi:hypothetical protein